MTNEMTPYERECNAEDDARRAADLETLDADEDWAAPMFIGAASGELVTPGLGDVPQDRSADGVPEVEQRLQVNKAIADDVTAPQRARVTDRESWWLHACGYVELHYDYKGTPAPSTCTKCDEVGEWRALYTLGGES